MSPENDLEEELESSSGVPAGRSALLAGGGGVLAAFASMACCTGPAALATFGASSAAVAAAGFRPYRPLFILMAAASLWGAYRLLDRAERQCAGWQEAGDQEACAQPHRLRRTRRLLWVLTGVIGVFLTSPWWDGLFLS